MSMAKNIVKCVFDANILVSCAICPSLFADLCGLVTKNMASEMERVYRLYYHVCSPMPQTFNKIDDY